MISAHSSKSNNINGQSDSDCSMNSLKQSNNLKNKNSQNLSSKQSSTQASLTGGEDQQPSLENQNLRIPVVFEWNGPNESVFLTGSFCNWKQKFQMTKITDNLFQITLVK